MQVVTAGSVIPAMLDEHINVASEAEKFVKDNMEQITCCTQHTLHNGIYSRTLFMPKGSVTVGVIIKVPTTLVLQGKMAVYIGEEVTHIDGYNVLTTMGNRKQIVYAIEDSYATLMFKTEAKTIDEAEQDMTDEFERLLSRQEKSVNLVNITGV